MRLFLIKYLCKLSLTNKLDGDKLLIKVIDSSRFFLRLSVGCNASHEYFCNIFDVQRWVGLASLRVKDGGIQTGSGLYSAFFVSFYSAALLDFCYLGQLEPDAEGSLLIRKGNCTLHLQLISNVVFSVLFNYFKRQQMANCLLAMHHFDCMMEVGQMR